jgi:hypothetical protein
MATLRFVRHFFYQLFFNLKSLILQGALKALVKFNLINTYLASLYRAAIKIATQVRKGPAKRPEGSGLP